MKQPIKAGDLAEVISGVLGKQSPNIGLVVKVLAQQGEHSQHGVIWLCEANGHAELAQEGTRDVAGGKAHFAQDWLRKIEPPSRTNQVTRTKELEKTQ